MRRHVLIHESEKCNVWMIEWPPGTGLDWHHHGGSYARITVIEGILTNWFKPTEWEPEKGEHRINSCEYLSTGTFSVPRNTEHKVMNKERDTAVSIHVYTPPLLMEYPDELEIG